MPSGSKTKDLFLNSIRQEEAKPALGMGSQAGNLCRRDVYKVCRGSQAGLLLLVFTQDLYLLLPTPRAAHPHHFKCACSSPFHPTETPRPSQSHTE